MVEETSAQALVAAGVEVAKITSAQVQVAADSEGLKAASARVHVAAGASVSGVTSAHNLGAAGAKGPESFSAQSPVAAGMEATKTCSAQEHVAASSQSLCKVASLQVHTADAEVCSATRSQVTAGAEVCSAIRSQVTTAGAEVCSATRSQVTAAGAEVCSAIRSQVTTAGAEVCSAIRSQVTTAGAEVCQVARSQVTAGAEVCNATRSQVTAIAEVCSATRSQVTAGAEVCNATRSQVTAAGAEVCQVARSQVTAVGAEVCQVARFPFCVEGARVFNDGSSYLGSRLPPRGCVLAALRVGDEGAEWREETPVQVREMPHWPHPSQDDPMHPGLLRYALSLEPQRILSCLGVDNPEHAEDELLRATMSLRELSPGLRLTAAAAWFRLRPERWQAHQDVEPITPTVSSSSEHSELPSSQSTATGGCSEALRGLRISEAESDEDNDRERLDQGEDADLEIELPVLNTWEQVLDEYRALYQRVSIMLRNQSRQVSHAAIEGTVHPEEFQLLQELSFLGWRLQMADFELAAQGSAEGPSLRALGDPEIHQEARPVLHTRLVSTEEVRAHLADWQPSMSAEYQSLLKKGAVEEVSDAQVESWIRSGHDVDILPGRGVPTEKPGNPPRKKYRAVICGNFQKKDPDRDAKAFHAGGADSVSIRSVLRWAGLRQAGASVTDIRTAFLNAPVDVSGAEFLVCQPPKHMVLAGVVPPRTKWRVRGALYGLVSSPRSWSVFRDSKLREFTWQCEDQSRVLQQCVAKDVLSGKVVGLVTCYVDDMLIVGSNVERRAFLTHLKSVWECNEPTHAEESVIKYCGLEIKETHAGLEICQKQYVEELLLRHPSVCSSAATPCCGWKEGYDDGETRDPAPEAERIREAQSLTGELLWLVVRARPEVSFPVSRMAQLCARRPQDALDIGYGVLRYLRGTVSQDLLYGPVMETTVLSEAEKFQARALHHGSSIQRCQFWSGFWKESSRYCSVMGWMSHSLGEFSADLGSFEHG